MNGLMTVRPQSMECERLVVGTIMMSYARCMSQYSETISESLIYDTKLNKIFKAILELGKENPNEVGATNPVFVYNRIGGDSQTEISYQDICSLIQSADPYEFGNAVRILQDFDRRRKLLQIGEMLESASTDTGTAVEATQSDAIEKLNDLFKSATSDIKSIGEVAESYDKDVIEANLKGTRAAGIPTGFSEYDDDCGGFQPSELVIIAGATSMGKSALAVCIAKNAAECGIPTAYYSLEMTAQKIYARMAASAIGIPQKVLNLKPLSEEQLQRYHEAEENLRQLPLHFDEKSTKNFEDILASIRTMVYKHHVKLVFIDFLQRISFKMGRNFNKEQVVGDAINKLADLARELKICVVVLSQLNRDRDNPRPSLDRLRDSGQIEQAADVVWLVYRPEYYDNPSLKYPAPFEGIDIHVLR